MKNIEVLREQVQGSYRALEIDRKKAQTTELKSQMNKPDFWQDQSKAVAISREAEQLEKEASQWDILLQQITELEELVAEGQRTNDESIYSEARKTYTKLKKQYTKMEFTIMFSREFDKGNAIVSIHAGTGGVDAQDWAEMLMRMYIRFCEKKKWKIKILDRSPGNEAGIKSVVIHVSGRWSYGYLKSESGVHRLVRISPFDAEGMRHTSFALVEVIPELPEAREVEVGEADLRIDVFRSSGPGGQGVNTTDSAVRITHIPSGIVAICQNERSQHQNKEVALKILKSRLYSREEARRELKTRKLKGEVQKAEWGKQIRSYVMQPYKMVKDHRTNHETQEIDKVMDGELEGFMEAYLRINQKKPQ